MIGINTPKFIEIEVNWAKAVASVREIMNKNAAETR